MASDEHDGPLFRVRVLTVTQFLDRATGEWKDSQVLPEITYTVVKRGDTIDLMTAQPVLDLASLPYRTIQQLLKQGDSKS